MNEKEDNNSHLPNNVIVSIAHLLLPEMQEFYNNKNDKDNIVQEKIEEKNEVKPSA